MEPNRWTKSSRSYDTGNCVEARLTETWRKSSRSMQNGACIEARHTEQAVEVRDTKDQAGPSLRFTGQAWTAFIDTIRAGG